MKSKSTALKAQEKILYNELIKYIELIAKFSPDFVEEFLDFGEKKPAFHIVSITKGSTKPLIFTSHMISAATLRIDDPNFVDMDVIATYGKPAIAAALLGSQFNKVIDQVEDVTEEIHGLSQGFGRA